MACKNCEESGSSDQDRRKALAEHALKVALSLPDDFTCQKNFTKPEAEFLSALRNLAVGLSTARDWSESEARSRYDSLTMVDAAIGYATARLSNNGGGDSPSCTAKCTSEKESCRRNCDSDDDAGYFCYFDCRLSYLACLGGCITHGFAGFGGAVIA